MTLEQNAAIADLKAEFTRGKGDWYSIPEVHEAIDRAVEISRRERVGTEEEVERVATALRRANRRSDAKMYVEQSTMMARAAISAMTPAAEVERLRVLETAARALIDDVRRRHPGEELHCPLMRALDEALIPAPPSGDPK